jgi:hypothetical protein
MSRSSPVAKAFGGQVGQVLRHAVDPREGLAAAISDVVGAFWRQSQRDVANVITAAIGLAGLRAPAT